GMGAAMTALPVPTDRVRVPLLLHAALPPNWLNRKLSACQLNWAPARLLMIEPLPMPTDIVPVQVVVPVRLRVRWFRYPRPVPLRVRVEPPAIVVMPAPLRVPLVQSSFPVTDGSVGLPRSRFPGPVKVPPARKSVASISEVTPA